MVLARRRSRCARLIDEVLGFDPAQGVGGGEDGDALMGADGQQMAAIAGDDQFGACGDGGGDDVIVIGIALDHTGDVDGG